MEGMEKKVTWKHNTKPKNEVIIKQYQRYLTFNLLVRSWHFFSTSASLAAGTILSEIFSVSESSRPNPSIDRLRRLGFKTGRPLDSRFLDLIFAAGLFIARLASSLLIDFLAPGLGWTTGLCSVSELEISFT